MTSSDSGGGGRQRGGWPVASHTTSGLVTAPFPAAGSPQVLCPRQRVGRVAVLTARTHGSTGSYGDPTLYPTQGVLIVIVVVIVVVVAVAREVARRK